VRVPHTGNPPFFGARGAMESRACAAAAIGLLAAGCTDWAIGKSAHDLLR